MQLSLGKSGRETYSYRKFEGCFRGSEREQEKDLRELQSKGSISKEIGRILETWNRNFGALDNMVFGYQDYITISRK